MDLKVFHDTVRFFVNKEQSGWFAPEEIDNLAHLAQMAVFNPFLDVYAKTQKLHAYLIPFSITEPFASDANGLVTLNATECYLPNLTVKYYESGRDRFKPVKVLAEDEIGERLDAQILQPTFQDPVAASAGLNKIQLYPQTVMYGTARYIKKPTAPVFSYTRSGRTISYDAVASTQLEWSNLAINKILIKTIQMAGVNISDQLIIQYTETKNQQDI